MLKFTGKEIGSIYIKESRLALERCNNISITKDDIYFGEFISGFRHSGERWFCLTLGKENITVKKTRTSLFRNHYQIIQTESKETIGYFDYSICEWLNPSGGILFLTNGEVFDFRTVSGILTKIWHQQGEFQMHTDGIKYTGEFKIDKSFNVTCEGGIEIGSSKQVLPAFLGLFFIDRLFRNWSQHNID